MHKTKQSKVAMQCNNAVIQNSNSYMVKDTLLKCKSKEILICNSEKMCLKDRWNVYFSNDQASYSRV
jgi:hypothetical protein